MKEKTACKETAIAVEAICRKVSLIDEADVHWSTSHIIIAVWQADKNSDSYYQLAFPIISLFKSHPTAASLM